MGGVLRTEEAERGVRLRILIGKCLNYGVMSKCHLSIRLKVSGVSEFGLVQGFLDATEQSGLTANLCCRKIQN